MAWGKAMATLAIKELYLLGLLEPLESAESPCQPGEKPETSPPPATAVPLARGAGAPHPHRGSPALCITSLPTQDHFSTRKYAVLSCDAV